MSIEDKNCERLSIGRRHIHAWGNTCDQAWGCIFRVQEIGYSVFVPSLWIIPRFLLPVLPYLLLTSLQPVFWELSGAPKGLGAIAKQMKEVSQNMKEQDIYGQQITKRAQQTHRV